MQYDQYKMLFEEFQLQNWALIPSFSMSDDPRVLNDQVSTTTYPQLQLDRPVWTPKIIHGGRHTMEIQATVAILMPGGADDDWITQETALDTTFPLLEKLIAYLDYKRKTESLIKVIRIGQGYAVERYETNLYGWALTVTLEAPASFCHDPDLDVEILHFKAGFVEGESLLQITVEGQNYQASLSESSRLLLAIDNLAGQISDDLAHNIQATRYDNRLILISDSPASPPITFNISLPGHSWTQISL